MAAEYQADLSEFTIEQRDAYLKSNSEPVAVDQTSQLNAETPGVLSSFEEDIKRRLYNRLIDIVDLPLINSLPADEARQKIRELSLELIDAEAEPLSFDRRQSVVSSIEDEVLGLGPLEPLLKDKTVSDILVNNHQQVYVERRGKLELTDIRFENNRHLMGIIDRIVSGVGRRIDESSPMVDARLEDGSRVNVVIPPLALDGPSLSIRRFAVELLGMENLIALGTVNESVAKVLQAIVKGRLNVLISGGTGAGKTTLLNIMSGFIPADERIVTIEDSAELQLQQPHVVRLETRPPNVEDKGAVTARDLVRNSLRMRPDRVVIGEVRGAEALDMLQAMNTGHDGSLTTVHANTPRDALGRVENMVTMSGVNFPMSAMRAQIVSAIDLVIQIVRHEDGKRRLTSIQEVNGMEGDIITMSDLFTFKRTGISSEGEVLGDLCATGVIPSFHKPLTARGIELPLSVFEAPLDAGIWE